jgi:hypothetical protein
MSCWCLGSTLKICRASDALPVFPLYGRGVHAIAMHDNIKKYDPSSSHLCPIHTLCSNSVTSGHNVPVSSMAGLPCAVIVACSVASTSAARQRPALPPTQRVSGASLGQTLLEIPLKTTATVALGLCVGRVARKATMELQITVRCPESAAFAAFPRSSSNPLQPRALVPSLAAGVRHCRHLNAAVHGLCDRALPQDREHIGEDPAALAD